MDVKDLKIFIGPSEIANVGALLAHGLRERTVAVTCATGKIRPYQTGMKYDVVRDDQGLNKWQCRFKTLYYFLKFLLQHNTFIFLFGNSLLPYNLDLPILRLFHKKTVMWFLGSDIRHYESLKAAAEKVGVKYYVSKDQGAGRKALKRKLRMICRVEKYVNYIISYPAMSQLLSRKYYLLHIPIETSTISHNNTPNPRPVVVHAPSDDRMKGTTYILKAVEQLKEEGYNFEFHLFRNTSNVKVRETLSEADIVVDQLFSSAGGMFAVESMAAGCAVLGGNILKFSGYPPELPTVHTDPGNIYQNLKMLLENAELRRELGEKGRKYVEKYHDYRTVADQILQLLSGNTEGLVWHTPPKTLTL